MRTGQKVFLIIVTSLIGLLLLAVSLYYLIYVMPTNSIMREAKLIFAGEKLVEKDHPLYRYSYRKKNHPETVRIEYEINRLWVWHNGKTGTMKLFYGHQYYKEDGDLDYESVADALWHIRKEGNKWVVYEVEEEP